MYLYRYRTIESALRDLEKNTVYFAPFEQLNDPIEGYVRVYWQGDKVAWEGLFRNYICSLYQAIEAYRHKADEDSIFHKTLILDIKKFDNDPMGQILKDLEDAFLADEMVEKIVNIYGTKYTMKENGNQDKNNEISGSYLKVSKEELEMIFCLIHSKAMILCIQKQAENGIIQKNEMERALAVFGRKTFSTRHDFEKLCASNEWIELLLDDEKRLKLLKTVMKVLWEGMELLYINLGSEDDTFFYGNTDGIINTQTLGDYGAKQDVTEARQRRNWMSVSIDFPKIYVNQLREMVYPKSFIACFSGRNDNSAMWGNYADHHKGVCLIYEPKNNEFEIKNKKNSVFPLKIKPVVYGGKLVECNFFNTLGRLTIQEIDTWLSGTGDDSELLQNFADRNSWSKRYWAAYEAKNYKKLKAWKYEKEYRLVLRDSDGCYNKTEDRIFEFMPDEFKGVIFGIDTSEYDKKRIVETLEKNDKIEDVIFYQAMYDEIAQKIVICEKGLWKWDKGEVSKL